MTTQPQRPVALVDGRNVQRSRWPNVPDDELVGGVRRWAGDHDVDATIVFDGRTPVEGPDVVATAGEIADDWIARRAGELRAEGRPYWLVTSDRGLRERTAGGAERVLGGGGFLAELQLEGGR